MQINFFKNCVKGFLSSVLAGALLILLFGYICYTREDPDLLLKPLGLTALYVSSLCGGFVSSRFNKEQGLLSGAATGGIFALFILVISFILRSEGEAVGFLGWILYLAVAFAGAVGGYIGKPSAKKRRKKHNRKKHK